jgi:acetyl/propionyl-CoA carboxylase alpha subunit
VGYDFRLEDRDARVIPVRGGAPLELEIDGQTLCAALEPGTGGGEYFLTLDGQRERLFIATRHDVHFVHWRGRTHRIEAWNALDRIREAAILAGGAEEIRAPMPGVVVSVAVEIGAEIERGALLLTIESMKLQTAITATHAARVAEVCVAAGDHFDQGGPLVRLEALAAPDGEGRES